MSAVQHKEYRSDTANPVAGLIGSRPKEPNDTPITSATGDLAGKWTSEVASKERDRVPSVPDTISQLVKQVRISAIDLEMLHMAIGFWSAFVAQAKSDIKSLASTPTPPNARDRAEGCLRLVDSRPVDEIKHGIPLRANGARTLTTAWQDFDRTRAELQDWQASLKWYLDLFEPSADDVRRRLENLRLASESLERSSIQLRTELINEIKDLADALGERLPAPGESNA